MIDIWANNRCPNDYAEGFTHTWTWKKQSSTDDRHKQNVHVWVVNTNIMYTQRSVSTVRWARFLICMCPDGRPEYPRSFRYSMCVLVECVVVLPLPTSVMLQPLLLRTTLRITIQTKRPFAGSHSTHTKSTHTNTGTMYFNNLAWSFRSDALGAFDHRVAATSALCAQMSIVSSFRRFMDCLAYARRAHIRSGCATPSSTRSNVYMHETRIMVVYTDTGCRVSETWTFHHGHHTNEEQKTHATLICIVHADANADVPRCERTWRMCRMQSHAVQDYGFDVRLQEARARAHSFVRAPNVMFVLSK